MIIHINKHMTNEEMFRASWRQMGHTGKDTRKKLAAQIAELEIAMTDTINLVVFANALLNPRFTYTVRCSVCGQQIGTTTDPGKVLDVGPCCKPKWFAEMRKEANLLSGKKAVEMVIEASEKEKRP